MTRFSQALIAAASSIALFGGALTLITPQANAQSYSCNTFGGHTSCFGSDGSTYQQNDFGGHSSGFYTDSYGNSSTTTCNSFGGHTSCTSF